jgi:hypothetical protein
VGSVRTDFREYHPGVAPADWSQQFQAVEATIRSPPVSQPDRHYLSVLEVAGSSGHAALTLDPLPAVERWEFCARMFMVGASLNLFWLRVSGTLGAENGVLLQSLVSDGQQEFFARKYVAGVQGAPIALAPSSVPTLPWAPFILRAELDGAPGAGVIRWRAWPVGADEPSEWDAEANVDASGSQLPATGVFAVAAQENLGDVRIDALSLAFE